MKKTLAILLVACLSIPFTQGYDHAYAKEKNKVKGQEKPLQEIYQEGEQLLKAGGTIEEFIAFKEMHGIETVSYNSVIVDSKGNEINPYLIQPYAMDASRVTITNYIDYIPRGTNAGRYAIYAMQQRGTISGFPWGEEFPASYDVISINWDPKVFQYVSSQVTDSSNVWLKDADKRYYGTVLFNMRDNIGTAGLTGWVIVNKLISNKFTTTSSKFTHTYNQTEKSTSQTGDASIGWEVPLTIGYSYTVNTSTVETNWSKSSTASVTTN